ncbi:protein Star-like [Procambarus clarkii]|uniref:protein Star-like n=1 Tax=Procambarus clarkii TaxID=6728 RepID=UPI003742EE8B
MEKGCNRLKGPLEADDPAVVQELRANFLAPPSTLPYNLTLPSDVESLSLGKSFSWGFYHHYIEHFFGAQRGGFFLEAGALEGEFLSNTLWLEQALGWSGLLIEADPGSFQHLTWKRRRAYTSHSCVTKTPYPREAVFETLLQDRNLKEFRWLFRANTREANSYFANFLDELSARSRRSYSKVQCFPLYSYLLALDVTLMDFLSLDIQGNEWEVIKSLPMDKVKVRAMAVEHMAPGSSYAEGNRVDLDFVSYMAAAGYRLVDVDQNVNYFFILESDSTLKSKCEPDKMVKYNHLNEMNVIANINSS